MRSPLRYCFNLQHRRQLGFLGSGILNSGPWVIGGSSTPAPSIASNRSAHGCRMARDDERVKQGIGQHVVRANREPRIGRHLFCGRRGVARTSRTAPARRPAPPRGRYAPRPAHGRPVTARADPAASAPARQQGSAVPIR